MSSQNIVNVLVIHGVLRLNSVALFLSPVLGGGEGGAPSPSSAPFSLVGDGGVTPSCTASTTALTLVDSCTRPSLANSGLRRIQLGTVPSYLLNVPNLPNTHRVEATNLQFSTIGALLPPSCSYSSSSSKDLQNPKTSFTFKNLFPLLGL